jgi:hypothetical protein
MRKKAAAVANDFTLFDLPEPTTDDDVTSGDVEVVVTEHIHEEPAVPLASVDAAPETLAVHPPILDAVDVTETVVVEEQARLFEDAYALRSPVTGQVFTDQEIIDEAYKWFMETGFPYRTVPRFVAMQQINAVSMATEQALMSTSEAYAVADSFHPHRFHATVGGKVSPIECFNNEEKFRHALRLCLEQAGKIPAGYSGLMWLARGTQACANFRPGFACWLYRRFGTKGMTVLDTSTGYGGRLVGFIASLLAGHYIGIDPNTQTHASNIAMASALGFSDKVTLYNLPAEDVDPALVAGTCDFSFTSPPYFSKEHYSEEPTQSWKRYGHSFEAWRDGFLKPMLQLTFTALKPGATAIINIEDVNIKTKRYPLVNTTVEVAEQVGFKHVGSELFKMTTRFGGNQDTEQASERVLIFRMPSADGAHVVD